MLGIFCSFRSIRKSAEGFYTASVNGGHPRKGIASDQCEVPKSHGGERMRNDRQNISTPAADHRLRAVRWNRQHVHRVRIDLKDRVSEPDFAYTPQARLSVDVDDACQAHVQTIMKNYPTFVDTRTGKNSGDPFVISLALVHNPKLIVVTEENGGSANRPAISYVCRALNITPINLLQLIQAYAWKLEVLTCCHEASSQ
jgi:hypothetical protein